MTDETESRAGFVALAGAPNVGKSTLLNRLAERRLSISTPKPQTTRKTLHAIVNRAATQMVIADTPGLHRPRTLMQRRMVGSARSSIHDADITCWMIAADKGMTPIDRVEMGKLPERRTVVVINKMDKVARNALLPIMADVAATAAGLECIPVSALKGANIEVLVERLAQAMPPGPHYYPDDAVTDQSERFLVAELVREQLFHQLSEELPYRVAVIVDRFEDKGRAVVVEATIYSDSTSSRKIILGAGGAMIKKIGIGARKAAERLLRKRVHITLNVTIRRSWQQDTRFLEELGM
jgi:GTP-binding protein Era